MKFASKWIELEKVILSKLTWTQKDKCIYLYVNMSNLVNGKQATIHIYVCGKIGQKGE